MFARYISIALHRYGIDTTYLKFLSHLTRFDEIQRGEVARASSETQWFFRAILWGSLKLNVFSYYNNNPPTTRLQTGNGEKWSKDAQLRKQKKRHEGERGELSWLKVMSLHATSHHITRYCIIALLCQHALFTRNVPTLHSNVFVL